MISDRRSNFYKGQFITIRPAKTEKPIIAVSKKISNKAVVRNKLRRQIKELLRQHQMKSVIVTVLRKPQENSFATFGQEVDQCSKSML